MQIKSFFVSGFRNLTGPLSFGPLQTVNVLYGPSNLGKSNLLRAMDLYFRLLAYDDSVTKTQAVTLEPRTEELRTGLALALNRKRAAPITFRVEWALTGDDLERAGVPKDYAAKRILTEFELKPANRLVGLIVEKFMLDENNVAVLNKDTNAEIVGYAKQLRRLLADCRPYEFDQPVHPYAFLGASELEVIPQPLLDRLFDARQSLDPRQRRRWALFVQTTEELKEALGPGQFDTAFDRASGHAELVYESEEEALPVRNLGAGTQQMIRLLAELCLSEEYWVAIEEPEQRLRPELQQRLVRVAERVVESGIGPKQLFFTSHSPVIAGLGQAFLLETGDGKPSLQQKKWEAAFQAAPAPPAPAAQPAPAAAAPATQTGAAQAAPAAGPAGKPPAPPVPEPELDGLIGLVDDLANLEPEKLVASAPAAPAPAGAGRSGGANPPPWKYKGGQG